MGRILTFMAVGAAALCGVLAAIYVWSSAKVRVPDRLCDYVSGTLRLSCVDVLQAEYGMHPGAVLVLREPKDRDEQARAELPRLDLLRESCRVPGTGAATALIDSATRSEMGLPSFTYELNGALKEGLELALGEAFTPRSSALHL